MGNCHCKKTTVDRGEAKVDKGFQNNPSQVNICACISYSVYSNAQVMPVRIYGEQYAHKICAIDNFQNITRRQAK